MTAVDLSKLSDAQILGLTGAGEARSELYAGHWQPAPMANMIAVMCTPLNRLKAIPPRFGETVPAICLHPKAYSCWTPGSGSNHDWVMQQAAAIIAGLHVAPIVAQCIAHAERLVDGDVGDCVSGATHYFSPVSMVPPGSVPGWAVGHEPVMSIGDQLRFYRGV